MRLFRYLPSALAAVALGAAVGLGSARAQVKLPDIGDSSGTVFSAADDAKLGEVFLRQVRARLTLAEDPELTDYVSSLGQHLVAKSDAPARRFRFFVVEDRGINAFAGPGGVIAVNTGLILVARNESELAAVIAHEIAHVTQRHLARAYEQAERASLPALAGVLAALIVGSQNPQAGAAAVTSVLARTTQNRLDFTRQNEQEADRVGIQLLHDAGFDPRAMPGFFEQLQQAQRYYSEPPEFLSTHPVTLSRIADSRGRAEQYSYRQFGDSEEFHYVKAKLRVALADDPKKEVSAFRHALETEQFRHRDSVIYGLALGLARTKQWDEAEELLSGLRDRHPNRVGFRAAQARIKFERGALTEAAADYRESLRLFPNDRALTRGYVEALLETGDAATALEVLRGYLKARRQTEAVDYRLLADTHDRLGNRFDSNTAFAEHHYLLGNLDAAIRQLQLALEDKPDDFYRVSRAEARLAEFRAEHLAANARQR